MNSLKSFSNLKMYVLVDEALPEDLDGAASDWSCHLCAKSFCSAALVVMHIANMHFRKNLVSSCLLGLYY
jgi:hypothetical protein